jgi:hypothetical protein
MIAELEHPSPEAETVPLPFNMFFNIVFNPDWSYPIAILPPDGGLIPVDSIPIEGDTTLTFTITTPGVTFQPPPSGAPAGTPPAYLPLNLSLGQLSNFFPPPVLSAENRVVTFTVSAPETALQPYFFNLIANVDGSFQGLLSNTVLITPTTIIPPSSLTLIYNTTTGQFALGAGSGWTLEPGEIITFLRNEPLTDPLTYMVTLNLVDETGASPSGLNFASVPFVCMSPTTPGWLGWEWVNLSRQSFNLINSIDANVGIAVPFHFVINYLGMDIRSPDPILINATIGDGG